MKFGKLKKAVSAAAAAVMCFTMTFGAPAYADNTQDGSESVWSETKAMTTAKYNSKYIKWVEKYSEKETQGTVTYGKSRTKKFIEKYYGELKSQKPEIKVDLINKEMILSVAIKGGKMKMVVYAEDEGYGIYMDSKSFSMLSASDKEMLTVTMPEDYDYDELMDSVGDFDMDDYVPAPEISDNAKGRIFKFKNGDNTYVYEEFSYEDSDVFGILFDSKGNPLACIDDEISACFKVSYSVKDSEFKLPSGYKEIDFD